AGDGSAAALPTGGGSSAPNPRPPNGALPNAGLSKLWPPNRGLADPGAGSLNEGGTNSGSSKGAGPTLRRGAALPGAPPGRPAAAPPRRPAAPPEPPAPLELPAVTRPGPAGSLAGRPAPVKSAGARPVPGRAPAGTPAGGPGQGTPESIWMGPVLLGLLVPLAGARAREACAAARSGASCAFSARRCRVRTMIRMISASSRMAARPSTG